MPWKLLHTFFASLVLQLKALLCKTSTLSTQTPSVCQFVSSSSCSPTAKRQCIHYTVGSLLKDHPISHAIVVSQDSWSLVTGAISLKCRTFCQEYMVFQLQDRWSHVTVVCKTGTVYNSTCLERLSHLVMHVASDSGTKVVSGNSHPAREGHPARNMWSFRTGSLSQI